MIKLSNPDCLPIKEMTSMEIALLYYLLRTDAFCQHKIKLSFSGLYLSMFGELYKSGNSRSMQIEYNKAVEHFESLGMLTTILDSHNCKVVDISSLVDNHSIHYVLIDDNCHKIFKDLRLAKYIMLKIFKTYVYMLTTIYRDPEFKGKIYNNYNLGFLSAEQLCKDLSLSYNTYSKYIMYLEDLKLIYVNRDNRYVKKYGGNQLIKTSTVYCRYEDSNYADKFVDAKNSKSFYKLDKTSDEAYYIQMYNDIENGNIKYSIDELTDGVAFLMTYDRTKNLSKIRNVIEQMKLEQTNVKQTEEDEDLPF